MSVLKLYKAEDNSLITEAPGTGNTVTFTLRADESEEGTKRLYAKCNVGYQATEVTVTPTGTNNTMWQLNTDAGEEEPTEGWEDWGESISLGVVTTSETYFWVRAKSAPGDSVGADTSVTLVASGIAEEVV